MPPFLPGALPWGPRHFPSGVTEAGSGTLLLGASYAWIIHPANPFGCLGCSWSPPLRLPPSSALLALPLGASSPFESSRSPSYLCPRSGRLLVPRPQSPFDPLLGSEPCDPVGGPHSQAAGGPTPLLGESSTPFVPSSLAPVAGGPQVSRASGGPRRPAVGPGAAAPQDPWPGLVGQLRSSGEWWQELGLHAGPRFSVSE